MQGRVLPPTPATSPLGVLGKSPPGARKRPAQFTLSQEIASSSGCRRSAGVPSSGLPLKLQAQQSPLHLQARLPRRANWGAKHVAPLWGLLACCNVSAVIAPGKPLHHYFHPEEGYSINCSRGLLGK